MRSRQHPGYAPGGEWWGFSGEPTAEEIRKAIEKDDLNPECNDGDKYPKDRKRHVARIAYLVVHPDEMEAIDVSHRRPGWEFMVENGAHRLLAHNYLKREDILCKCNQHEAQ